MVMPVSRALSCKCHALAFSWNRNAIAAQALKSTHFTTGACFGAGLDIISAADIRYCTEDAYFCVKEVDLAITADMGVLQRLPGLVGQGDCAPFSLCVKTLSSMQSCPGAGPLGAAVGRGLSMGAC